jgi:short-subunit dehydrogenase
MGRVRRSHRADAVVTGAGSGIGRAFAIELASRGGRVVCSDIDAAAAEETAAAIGAQAVAVACDVAELADVTALAGAATDFFGGPPTLVINNAGVGAGGTVVGATPWSEWQRTLGINLYGVIHGCHVFVPALRAAGRGGVINVASAAGFAAAPTMAPYNVSKAGVVALSETLAAELAGTGIAVSVLCPTFVKTNILDTDHISAESHAMAQTMMRLTGMSAQRVARGCLDAHDRGRLYVVPQLDAKVIWHAKRAAPAAYTRTAGLLGRVAPQQRGSAR